MLLFRLVITYFGMPQIAPDHTIFVKKFPRELHCERNLPNPLENNFLLTHTMKGIRRCLGDTVVRKKPVTPDMLKCIIKNLDLKKTF